MVDLPYIPGARGHHARPAIGYAMVLVAATLFGLNGTVSKVVLASGISSLELTEVRSLGACLGFAVAIAIWRPGALRVTRRELPFLVAFGVVGVALVQWLYFVAIHRLPIGIALLIEYIAPLIVALWARFVWHEPVRRRVWVALACSLRGLALVVEVWAGGALDGVGVVAALGGAFAYAAYVLLAERGWRGATRSRCSATASSSPRSSGRSCVRPGGASRRAGSTTACPCSGGSTGRTCRSGC